MNEAAAHAAAMAERAARESRQRAQKLGLLLNRTAAALEQSAKLADEHAERQARAGREEDAAHERRAARRAHAASQRARVQALRCLELADGPTP